MSSMRDAMRRLQVIYENCVPEAIEAKEAEAKLDEFTRLRKRLHGEVKSARQVLHCVFLILQYNKNALLWDRQKHNTNQAVNDRNDLIEKGGTKTESAEASYRIRLSIKSIKEIMARMQEIHDKERRKAGIYFYSYRNFLDFFQHFVTLTDTPGKRKTQ